MQNYYKHKIDKPVKVSKLVTVHYFELNKDFEYPPESHDFWELNYVDKGHLYCYNDQKEIELFQGDIVFFKPNVRHYIRMDKNTPSNMFVISFECNSDIALKIKDEAYKLNTHEKSLVSTIFEEANKTFEIPKFDPDLKKLALKQDAPIGSMQLIQIALEELLIKILRKESNSNNYKSKSIVQYDDRATNDIISYLSENLTEKLSLSDISKKMGYGKTFLCTRFKQVTGKTIFRFLTELQIEEAKKMIRQSKDNTISIISDTLNFSEPAYFCNVFKKITGMSPKEYSRTIHAFDKE